MLPCHTCPRYATKPLKPMAMTPACPSPAGTAASGTGGTTACCATARSVRGCTGSTAQCAASTSIAVTTTGSTCPGSMVRLSLMVFRRSDDGIPEKWWGSRGHSLRCRSWWMELDCGSMSVLLNFCSSAIWEASVFMESLIIVLTWG